MYSEFGMKIIDSTSASVKGLGSVFKFLYSMFLH